MFHGSTGFQVDGNNSNGSSLTMNGTSWIFSWLGHGVVFYRASCSITMNTSNAICCQPTSHACIYTWNGSQNLSFTFTRKKGYLRAKGIDSAGGCLVTAGSSYGQINGSYIGKGGCHYLNGMNSMPVDNNVVYYGKW